MKTIALILLVLSLAFNVHAQSGDSQQGTPNVKTMFYTSGCEGDSLRVSIYSTDGALLSTLMIPDDSELAILSDSSRTTRDLTEFRGIVKIRSKPIKTGSKVPTKVQFSDFDSAPIQLDLMQAFVIVHTYDCSKVSE
jgi:hypothetical protein